mmetsp:Transcript_3970/g.7010  ORF Transcript_3970/g.7010 Transcript_3970/m.7010 type:complete len:202 (-) Transcript_3970:251-856(-)
MFLSEITHILFDETGATASRSFSVFFRRRNGPMLSTGIRMSSLLRKATKRKSAAGDRDSRVGSDFLSLASEVVDTPRLLIKTTTCIADLAPPLLRRPGHDLKTALASYLLSFNVFMRSSTKTIFKRPSRVSFDSIKPPSFPQEERPREVEVASDTSALSDSDSSSGLFVLSVATLGVCSKIEEISLPLSPLAMRSPIASAT